jgi:CheY-like chemotaxis protein
MATILIVEDTPDNFDLMEDALAHAHDVVNARTGLEGLTRAKTCGPDLILLDMSLPGLDGWEVVRELKADPYLAGIPVLAVTAHAMRGDRERCLEAGCDGYMAKPISIRELTGQVESFLQRGVGGLS